MLDSVNTDAGKLEAVAKRFDSLEAETKMLQETAEPLIVAITERASWAEILEELGAKLPPRFIWVTDIKALSDGKPYVQSAGPPPLTPTQKSDAPKQAGSGAEARPAINRRAVENRWP